MTEGLRSTRLASSAESQIKDEDDNHARESALEAKRLPLGLHHLRRRLAHLLLYSSGWSLMPLATLGFSILLNAQRSLHNFHGLYTLGLIVYFFGLLQWVLMLLAKIIHFTTIRHSVLASFESPEETILHASFWMGCYALIAGAIDFAAPEPGSRLSETFFAVFGYFVCADVVSLALHLALFHKRRLEAWNMTPAWSLPLLPVILVGVLAGTLAFSLDPAQDTRYYCAACMPQD